MGEGEVEKVEEGTGRDGTGREDSAMLWSREGAGGAVGGVGRELDLTNVWSSFAADNPWAKIIACRTIKVVRCKTRCVHGAYWRQRCRG